MLSSSAGNPSFGLFLLMFVFLKEHWIWMDSHPLAFHSQTTQVLLKDFAMNPMLLLFNKPLFTSSTGS